jgi:hypothetical protein
MDFHVRSLGWSYIIYGSVSALVSLLILIFLGGLYEAWTWTGESQAFAAVFVGALLGHMLLGVPMVVGGIFLLRLHEWARLMMIIVSALNILNVPLGSLLGGYGLWVLLQPETEPLFSDPVFKGRRAARPVRKPNTRHTSADPITPQIKNATTNLPE